MRGRIADGGYEDARGHARAVGSGPMYVLRVFCVCVFF